MPAKNRPRLVPTFALLGAFFALACGSSESSTPGPAAGAGGAGGAAGGAGGGGSGGGASAPVGKRVPLYVPRFESTRGPVKGVPWAMQLPAAGGLPPYSFSLSSGALPGGLSLDASGVISGVPSPANTITQGTVNVFYGEEALGTVAFTIKVTDARGSFAFAYVSMQVGGDGPASSPPKFELPVPQLPLFGAGEPVGFLPSAFAGASPYAWSITGLPAGLSVDPKTGTMSGASAAAAKTEVVFSVNEGSGAEAEFSPRSRTLSLVAFEPFDGGPFDGHYEGTLEQTAPFGSATGFVEFQVRNDKVVSEGAQTGQEHPLRGEIQPSGAFVGTRQGRWAGNKDYTFDVPLSGTFSASAPFELSGVDASGKVKITLKVNHK